MFDTPVVTSQNSIDKFENEITVIEYRMTLSCSFGLIPPGQTLLFFPKKLLVLPTFNYVIMLPLPVEDVLIRRL